jgi:hypothetical protein
MTHCYYLESRNTHSECIWYKKNSAYRKRVNGVTIANKKYLSYLLGSFGTTSSLAVRCKHQLSPLAQSLMRVLVYIHSHRAFFPFFGHYCFVCMQWRKEKKNRKKKSKRTADRQLLRPTIVRFFPLSLSYSEIYIEWINH